MICLPWLALAPSGLSAPPGSPQLSGQLARVTSVMRWRGDGRGGAGRGASSGLLRWVGLAVTATAAVVGVWLYLGSPVHQRHDPNHALQQLDLLYLDEPAPGVRQLGIEPGRSAVVVFCEWACAVPELALGGRLDGHVYSAVPDVLFLGFGVLHVLWMDVFAFHITLHFVPVPLVTMLVLFVLTLLTYGLAASGKALAAVGVLAGATGVLVIALALAAPLPRQPRRPAHRPRLRVVPGRGASLRVWCALT